MKTLVKALQKILNSSGYEINLRNRGYWPRESRFAQTFLELDEGFNSLYGRAQMKTQMTATDNALRRQRHYTLHHLLRCTDLEKGDVCEIGCWRGLSAYQIASHIAQNHLHTLFHVFDSFEGLSEITSSDVTTNGIRDEEILQKTFACSLELVQENLSEFDLIKYYKGWIPDRFDEVKDIQFSFVHIDVDLYQPTHDAFSFLYPRVVKHGIIVFDDYGCTQFPGAKKAIDEHLATIRSPFSFLCHRGKHS